MPFAVRRYRKYPLITVQRPQHRMIHYVPAEIGIGFEPIHGLLTAGEEMLERSSRSLTPGGVKLRRRLNFG